jgi:CubicO group peptidase (beta-lactamase class C family)
VTFEISALLQRAIDAGKVPGVVAVATHDGRLIYKGAHGKRDLTKSDPMTCDSVFWIASMTKAVTSVALMQLVERGQISLEQDARTILPALGDAQVLDGFDAAGKPQLREPKSHITVRQLLTHTAGFSYDIWNADLVRYRDATGTPGVRASGDRVFAAPLIADPGTRWEYGIAIDWCGKLIEAISGQTLEAYLRTNVLDPLAMQDTSFKIGASQRARLVRMHSRQAKGLVATDFELPQSPELHMGGGGLYGTVPDYLHFTQMILNRGRAASGTQILKPETIALMSRNHIGALEVQTLKKAMPALTNDANFFPGMVQKWGLSFLINTEMSPQGRSAGSLSWAGLANTYYWIDPTTRVTGILATQLFPFADIQALQLFRDFEAAVYRTL